ncbi:MAG TPA: hypothetical protein VII98_06555 [Solirubrobacteraceae bacterium]
MNWQLIAPALEAALYPTLLAAVAILLSQPRRVRSRWPRARTSACASAGARGIS